MWITLNEPNDEVVSYQEGHQMLLAHALAWHVYDKEFRKAQGGQVGTAASFPLHFQYDYQNAVLVFLLNVVLLPQVSLTLHMDWVEPAFSFSREDVEPAKRVLDFRVGWFAEPIFGSGDYPLGMRSWLRQLNSLEYQHFLLCFCLLDVAL